MVVMTTEVLRNMIYAGSSTLANLGYVVMDEVHYLADRFRGAVWEEVIIGLAESIQLVALSATVSNAEEFGEWLSEVRGEMAVVVSERRPVPLYQHVLVGTRLYDLFAELAPTARELPGEASRRQPGADQGCAGGVPAGPRRRAASARRGRAGPAHGELRQRRVRRCRAPVPLPAAQAVDLARSACRAGRTWSSCWTRTRCCRPSCSSSPGSAAMPPCASCSASGLRLTNRGEQQRDRRRSSSGTSPDCRTRICGRSTTTCSPRR